MEKENKRLRFMLRKARAYNKLLILRLRMLGVRDIIELRFDEGEHPRDDDWKFKEKPDAPSEPQNGKEKIKSVFEKALTEKTSDEAVKAIMENHKMLGEFTPAEMKTMLEDTGFDVQPLGRGNFKGVSFEDGGGYRINFGGDGTFRYHPKERSHHKSAYWKIINGKEEHRYDIDGKENFD